MTADVKQLVTEIMSLLYSMAPAQSRHALGILKDESDPAKILSVLRGGIKFMQRPSDHTHASAVVDRSFEILELGAQNLTAYPFLPPIDEQVIQDIVLLRAFDSRDETLPPRPYVSCMELAEKRESERLLIRV